MSGLVNSAPHMAVAEGEYVMEYQLESERGFHFMGANRFSPNMRLPRDPARFTSVSGEPLGAQLTDFEVPDDTWVWLWSRWYVDMTADVDDQGWCYAGRFHSVHWAGRHRFLRSFVRQRVWKRPRLKRHLLAAGSDTHMVRARVLERLRKMHGPRIVDQHTGAVVEDELQTLRTSTNALEQVATADSRMLEREEAVKSEENELERTALRRARTEDAETGKLLAYIRHFRNDREKVDGIIAYIAAHPEQHHLLVRMRDMILAQLNFKVSQRALVTKLSESTDPNCQLFLLAPSSTWRDLVLQRGEPEREPANLKADEANLGA